MTTSTIIQLELIGIERTEVKMKNYIVKTTIEFAAASQAEAEDIVLGMELVDLEGKPLEEVYIEIEEVEAIG